MADKEHLKILKQGVKVWNKWRMDNPDTKPHLSKANLNRANLSKANLIGANLFEANLMGAYLSGAYLNGANLSGVYLSSADLFQVNLSKANLFKANLFGANLSRAYLFKANLIEANLIGADLSRAYLIGVNLTGSDLTRAKLTGAKIHKANLRATNLSKAYLIGADLSGADLIRADLSETNISGANLYDTARDDWKIDDIICDYAFFDPAAAERVPKDRSFKHGEFEELFKTLPTVEYHFDHAFSPAAAVLMDQVAEKIRLKHPEFELKLTAFYAHGRPSATFTVLHKEYVENAFKKIKQEYESRRKLLGDREDDLMNLMSVLTQNPQIIDAEAIQDVIQNGNEEQQAEDTWKNAAETPSPAEETGGNAGRLIPAPNE